LFRKKAVALLFLLSLAVLSWPQSGPSCKISAEFPLSFPGSSVALNVSYEGLPLPSPIFIVCRPNQLKFCLADAGSGYCDLACDYPYKGVYTVTGASAFSSCTPSLVVVDPDARPKCILTAGTSRGKGNITTKLVAKFSNLLPNATTAVADCGNGDSAFVLPLETKGIQMSCSYGAVDKKEVFMPSVSSGSAKCYAQISVIPISDTQPPTVSFYNFTYRLAVANTTTIIVNASDNVEVDRVELFVNGTLKSTMRTPPYSYFFDVQNYSNGTLFVLTAVAYDIYGNSNATPNYDVYRSYGGTRSCNLTAIPIYSPIPASITLKAVFYNTSSDVLVAAFKPDWSLTTMNFSEPFTPIINGIATTRAGYEIPATYTAYVTDGNASCTTKVYITATPDEVPPTVILTSPTDNQNIRIGDTVDLRATVNDNVFVQNVEYYIENRLIDNVSNSPFNTTWNTTNESIGVYYVKAISYDPAGNPSNPDKHLIILYTNRTCKISPSSAIVLPKKQANFTISCFNYTMTNVTQSVTNETQGSGAENFTITSQDLFSTVLSPITCPDMQWSSSFARSDITPKLSPSGVSLNPQDTQSEITGTITATDPVSGFSCSSRLLLAPRAPGCAVRADRVYLLGSHPEIAIDYENVSKQQDFRVTCRPNSVTICQADPGSGSCSVICDYPILGRFWITASSPLIACTPKRIAILPQPDLLPPVVSITKPFNRQIISGIIQVEAYATDNYGVATVELYADSSLIGTSEFSSYALNLNTTKFKNGVHTLRAKAYDDTGNWIEYSITVTISNK